MSPVDAQIIEQPIFIAHGDADLNIKFAYGQQLYEQAKSTDKEFYRVKDGGHYGCLMRVVRTICYTYNSL